jgi:hypothetical protein
MSNKRITDLTELTNPTTDDVFPVVDIATNTTTKVQLGNLPVPSSVTTALATKQDSLVSGTNIKTINSTSVLGSGNIAVQETLVSGTNIKTLNNTSLLGSGNIVLTANPSGVSGAIQFSNGSAFASDADNFFWDDTNNRLGVGTNAPSATIHAKSAGDTNATIILRAQNGSAADRLRVYSDGWVLLQQANNRSIEINPGGYISYQGYSLGVSIDSKLSIGSSAPTTGVLNIKGSGSTSATTSLLVQNSAGTDAMTVRDNLQTTFGGTILGTNCVMTANVEFQNILYGSNFFSQNTGATTLGSSSAADASAMLDIRSTTRGFLPPRMTTIEKNAIASPAAGLIVYDSTTNKLCCYNGSTWNDLF